MKFRLNAWSKEKEQDEVSKQVYMIKDYKNKEPWS